MKTKQNKYYFQSVNKNRAAWTCVVQRGNKELPAVRHSFRGMGTLTTDSLGFALFLEILFWVSSLLRTDDLFHCAQKPLCTVRVHTHAVSSTCHQISGTFTAQFPPKEPSVSWFEPRMKFMIKQLIIFRTREL